MKPIILDKPYPILVTHNESFKDWIVIDFINSIQFLIESNSKLSNKL